MTHMPAIPIDATSNARWPTSLAEWQGLLAGAFLPPASSWGMQDASGGLVPDVSANALAVSGAVSLAYQQPAIGWSRFCLTQGATSVIGASNQGYDISTTSELFLVMLRCDEAPASTSDILALGLLADANKVSLLSTGLLQVHDKSNVANGAISVVGTSFALAFKVDRTVPQMVVYNDTSEIIKPTWSAPSSGSGIYLGLGASWPTNVRVLGAALWQSTAAELSDANVVSLITLLKTGHTT